jgi:hypothetical protein
LSRSEMRDYVYTRRTKRLLASGGVKAIRARIEEVKRRKTTPEKRKRQLAILRSVLR